MFGDSQTIVDDEFDLGIENGRRESNIGNDDDYDYALELLEDDEYRLTAQAMQEVKDFPDEITGKTYSPIRPTSDDPRRKTNLFSSLVDYGKRRLSMVTGEVLKPPVSESDKRAISHKDFLPPTPEEEKKSRRSSISSLFSKKSNSPSAPSPASARLNFMERGGAIPEDRSQSDSEHSGDKEEAIRRLADNIEENLNLSDFEIEGEDEDDPGEGDGRDSSFPQTDGQDNLSKSEFKTHLKQLNRRKKWAENSIRRASDNFVSNYDKTGKAAMDRFIVAMSRGVAVRRHQAGCLAEEVRLYSDNGCHSINWEPPKRDKHEVPKQPITLAAAAFDGSTFDCCITVCGCGDNLQDAHDLSRINNRDTYKTNADGEDGDDPASAGRGGLWSSLRFRRRGVIEDSNMVAIQPATRDDPTRPGFIGTHTFRNTRDVFNQALSFSIVTSALSGVSTLDIECANEEEYFILLSGFLMLCTEAHLRHAQNKKLKRESKLVRSESKVSETWERYQSSLFPPEAKKMDPIEALFYVSSGLMLPLQFNTVMKPGQESIKKDYDLIPPSQFLGWKSAGTQIWARLRLAGLDVKCVFSWDLRRVILKLKCPQWRLEEVAEKMHMKLKKRDGTFKRFKRSRRGTFVAAGFNGSIFRSSERQRIIDFILRSKIIDGGAELDEDTKLGQCIKSRFPLHMHERLDMLKHSWVTFWKIEQPGEIATPWSVLDVPLQVTVKRIWTSAKWTWDGLLSQPLDSIAEYYGEDVAFYFAWMSFFSRWLVLPSILGVIVFCGQVYERRLDHWLCIPYAVLIIMWSCVLLAFWRQKAATLAHRWGVLDYDVEETERPQFRGKYMYDPSLGEVRKLYPSWKRFIKYCISYPIILFFVGSVLVLMIVTSTTNEALSSEYDNGDPLNYSPRFRSSFGLSSSSSASKNIAADDISPEEEKSSLANMIDINYWIVNLIYPSIYGLITNVAAELFEMLAVGLTDFENHQTESSYWNQLIIKIFSVRFVTVFTSIFYYAFRSGIDSETAYKLMSLTIFAFITVGDWWGKFIQICVPSWVERFRLYRMKAAVVTLRKHIWKLRAQEVGGDNGLYMMARRQHYLSQSQEQCWQEALKKDYTTFGDYTRLMIQLGFVLFFAAVFPLSPLIVLINNIFFIRLDAFKLTNTRKRPIAQKSAGLGVWEDILQMMSVAGIITNCCIVGITSSVLPGWMKAYGTVGVAIVLFFFEHIMLLFKYMLHKAIPKIPITVQREIIGLLPNGTAGKSKSAATKKKKRPKFVKEFNPHEDDLGNNGGSAVERSDALLHEADKVHLSLDDEVDDPSEALDEWREVPSRGNSSMHSRSISDDLCSELSDDLENKNRCSIASRYSMQSHGRGAKPPPRGGAKGGVRRRSSIRTTGGPAQAALSTSVLRKSPVPRRSAVLFKKSHPLAMDSEFSSPHSQSNSDDSSSNDDVSVTRLKMKIQALKRKGKKLKADSDLRSRSFEDETGEDESPTSRARRRIAQSSRIPFQAYPAHALVTNTCAIDIQNAESEIDGDANSGIAPMRKRSIIDPVLGFLQRSGRSASKDSQEGRPDPDPTLQFAYVGADLELAPISGMKPQEVGTAAQNDEAGRLSISNLPSVEVTAERKNRSRSIASSAWDFVRGIGFSLSNPSDSYPQPVESVVMEERLPPRLSPQMQTAIEPERLPTYEEAQQLKFAEVHRTSNSPGHLLPRASGRDSPHRDIENHQPANISPVSRQSTEAVSPTLSSIKNRGAVRTAASAINGKSPAAIAQQRQAEAYKAHIGRNRQTGTPLTRTSVVSTGKKPEQVPSSSPLPKSTAKKTPIVEASKPPANKKVTQRELQVQRAAPASSQPHEWETLPESVGFISRLKNQPNRRQSIADSPFMMIVNDTERHEEEYEESPEESVATIPKVRRQSLLSPPRGNLRQDFEDDDYEPSPVGKDATCYMNQYSEDYDDTYEDSPVSNRGGRKSIMKSSRRNSMHSHQQHTPPDGGYGHGNDDDTYEASPPSPRHRPITERDALRSSRTNINLRERKQISALR